MSAPTDNRSAWFRQLWPWLLMLPPLAAVVGGVTMIWLATHTPAPLVVEDYARIEELTQERFAKDAYAAVNRISATLEIDRRVAQPSGIFLHLSSGEPAALPDSLSLRFRHVTNVRLDRTIQARRDARGYVADVELGNGTYLVEIEPPDGRWRLAARLREFDTSVALRAGESSR